MLFRDIKCGMRSLSRAPGFVAVAVLSLALGIGATTTAFTVVEAMLLRPAAGVERPEELVGVYTSHARGDQYFYTSYLDFLAIRQQADSFVDMTAFAFAEVSVGTHDGSVEVPGEMVTANYFELLGVRPALGRTFAPEETRIGSAERVAVIAHGLWRRHFGADPDIVGSTIRLEGKPFTVVGVAPEGFTSRSGPFEAGVWFPIGIPGRYSGYTVDLLELRYRDDFSIIGRLAPGHTLAQAQAQLDLIAERLIAEFPDDWRANDGGYRSITAVGNATAGVPPQILPRGALLGFGSFLLVISSLVVFIACCNTANLLLARGVGRSREMAVRMALGASRRRLVAQLLTESLLVAGAGGLAGLLLATWATSTFRVINVPPIPLRLELPLDGRVLAFTLAFTLLTGLLFGIIPALRASAHNLSVALKNDVAAQGNRLRHLSLRNALVVAQVAVSLALLVGAGQVLLGLRSARQIDIGFEPGELVAVGLNAEPLDLTDAEAIDLYDDILEQMRGFPGVRAVSLAAQVPLSGSTSNASVRLPGGQEESFARVNTVSPGYFESMRVPLIEGRTFEAGDRGGAAPLVIVNQTLAQRLWPNRVAVGELVHLRGAPEPARVVGVVGDGKYLTLGEAPRPHFWVPLAQSPRQRMIAHIEPEDGARLEFTALARQIRADHEGLIVMQGARIEELIGATLLPQRVASAALASAGALAVFLAVVGLYGVIAHAVHQRSREIAIRMALGATEGAVMRTVIGQGLALTLVGVGAGVILLLAATTLISSVLLDVGAIHPLAMATGIALLFLASALASWLPARRAASIDPSRGLHAR